MAAASWLSLEVNGVPGRGLLLLPARGSLCADRS
jgi:hypothetical protein